MMKKIPYLLLKAGQVCIDKRFKNPDRLKREADCMDLELWWNGQKVELSSITRIVITVDPEQLIQMDIEHLGHPKETIRKWIIKLLQKIYYKR